ncbi:MAG TPA: hypothetical protein VGK23_10295 [Methanomassiliicoccales archaeon]
MEALAIFVVTVVVFVVIITVLDPKSDGSNQRSFPLSNGDYIEFSIHGTVHNVSVGGEFIYYFTERNDRGPDYYVLTLAPRAPTDQTSPFGSEPFLASEYFYYNGLNLTGIGGLLVHGFSHYNGANTSDLWADGFGDFINYENVNRYDIQGVYSNGIAAHYSNSSEGTTMEQWIANGTGLPVMLNYSDVYGNNLSLTISYSNIQWISNLPRGE